MEPDELIEEGNDVLAMVRYRLRGAESGIDIEHPVAHLMRVEDGLIRAWWMFGDPEKARRRFVAGDRPG
jgi:ketosteroid isomerase-like protein